MDLKSVKLGLKLHRSRFGGRLINVRPTRTEAELLNIVAKRNEGLLTQGLAFKANDEKPEAANLAKRPKSESAESSPDAIEKSKRKAKKEAAKLKRALPKDIARPNIEALAAREKWSESKKKRERANHKKRLAEAAEQASAK
jgi:nitrogenase subunit NifH